MQPQRQTLKKILLALASFVLAAVAAELVLRALDYRYKPLKIAVHGIQTDWRFEHSFTDDRFVYDPDSIWRPKANCSVFNSQGFRGSELPKEKGANEFRIFTIGDSNTLGWDSSAKDRGSNWPEDLQNLLAAPAEKYAVRTDPGTRFSVTNAGVWGYTSFQGKQRLKQILPFLPDMVLVSFGSNDAMLVGVPDARYTSTFIESLVGRTRIGQFALGTADRVAAAFRATENEDMVRRVSVEQYKANLSEIIEICRAGGIQCVLLTRPFIGDCKDHIQPELWWKFAAPAYVKATLEVGRQHGVPVIDVHDRFKDELDLFADESHFTEAGHQLAAEFIYENIKPLLPADQERQNSQN